MNKQTTLVLMALLTLGIAVMAWGGNNPTFVSRQYGETFSKGIVRTSATEQFKQATDHTSFSVTGQLLPSHYSIRGEAGPVENQGQCGSCWDFSLVTALRGTFIMAGNDPGRLSFNYLLNCDKVDQGCNGGDFTAAAFLKTPKGDPAYGSDGQYIAADGKCKQAVAVASASSYHMLGLKGKNPSFEDIAYVVGVLHKPVSIDLAVDANWQSYSSGVYNGCSDEVEKDINHMIVIEGYDCETSKDANGNCVFDVNGNLPNGVGTWLARNSWGVSWGDGGYITTKATDANGIKCNMIGDSALYFNVAAQSRR